MWKAKNDIVGHAKRVDWNYIFIMSFGNKLGTNATSFLNIVFNCLNGTLHADMTVIF